MNPKDCIIRQNLQKLRVHINEHGFKLYEDKISINFNSLRLCSWELMVYLNYIDFLKKVVEDKECVPEKYKQKSYHLIAEYATEHDQLDIFKWIFPLCFGEHKEKIIGMCKGHIHYKFNFKCLAWLIEQKYITLEEMKYVGLRCNRETSKKFFNQFIAQYYPDQEFVQQIDEILHELNL